MTLPTAAGSEREGRGAEPRPSRALAFIGIFLLWWILAALVYRHTPINFLRAESGWYLFLSHSSPLVQHNTEKDFWTTSFNGHYAPLAFRAEYETAKLVGTHASFWKWRQITVLAFARHNSVSVRAQLRVRLTAIQTASQSLRHRSDGDSDFSGADAGIHCVALYDPATLLARFHNDLRVRFGANSTASGQDSLAVGGGGGCVCLPFIFTVWASRPWQPPPPR
jgi:hypothetical protein